MLMTTTFPGYFQLKTVVIAVILYQWCSSSMYLLLIICCYAFFGFIAPFASVSLICCDTSNNCLIERKACQTFCSQPFDLLMKAVNGLESHSCPDITSSFHLRYKQLKTGHEESRVQKAGQAVNSRFILGPIFSSWILPDEFINIHYPDFFFEFKCTNTTLHYTWCKKKYLMA